MHARPNDEQKTISKKTPLVKKGSRQEWKDEELFDFINSLLKFARKYKEQEYTFSRDNVQALEEYIPQMRTPSALAMLTKSFVLLKNNRQKLKKYKLDTILLDAAKKMIGKIENDGKTLTNIIWGLAKLGFKKINFDKKFIGFLHEAIKNNISEFNEQGISNTLWGLATLGFEAHDLATIKDALFSAIVKNSDQLSPQNIANILWALATLGFKQEDLATIQGALFSVIDRNKDQFNPQDIANTVWSCARIGIERQKGAEYTLVKQLFERAASLSESKFTQESYQQLFTAAHYFNTTDHADFIKKLEKGIKKPISSETQIRFFHCFQQNLSSEWYRVRMEVLIMGYFVDILISKKVKLPDGTTTEIHMIVEIDGSTHLEKNQKEVDKSRDLLLKQKSDIIDIIRIQLDHIKKRTCDSEIAQRVKEVLLSPVFKKYFSGGSLVTMKEEKQARKEVLDQKIVVSSVEEATPKKIEEKAIEKQATNNKQDLDPTQTSAILSKEKDEAELETKTRECQDSKPTLAAEPITPVSIPQILKPSREAKPFVPVVLTQRRGAISQNLSFWQEKDGSCRPARIVLASGWFKKGE